jgi:hypothetical protein
MLAVHVLTAQFAAVSRCVAAGRGGVPGVAWAGDVISPSAVPR